MNNIWVWFAGLATISGMGYFLLGFSTSYAIWWFWCMHKHRKLSINWRYAGIAVGTVMIIFVSLQTQVAYNTAKQTALDVKDCQRQFQTAIKAARDISAENDNLSIAQRDLFAEKDRAETRMWIDLLAPPDDIGKLSTSDQRRQDYGLQVVGKYSSHATDLDTKIKAIQDRQNQLIASRPPLPEPTCGK